MAHDTDIEARLLELVQRGIVWLARERLELRSVARRPGALSRFLEERNAE